jgi:uncharacterized Fe-S cluster-containing radical SAM superfamily protein
MKVVWQQTPLATSARQTAYRSQQIRKQPRNSAGRWCAMSMSAKRDWLDKVASSTDGRARVMRPVQTTTNLPADEARERREMATTNTISGTKEWAAQSCNCVNGCSHDCRYCYARYDAVDRYGRMTREQWPVEQIRQKDVAKPRHKMQGRIMFPTTHDITPNTLEACLTVLQKLLAAGNEVLIVSKPHLACVDELCCELENHKPQITFRFTIGTSDDAILSYWEPGAPGFWERFRCLQHAYVNGYRTSVSMEPLLGPERAAETVAKLQPYVSDSIWIGTLNRIDQRVLIANDEDRCQVERLKRWQTPDAIRWVYERLKDNPLVKWKESYKQVLGLKLADRAGQDE